MIRYRIARARARIRTRFDQIRMAGHHCPEREPIGKLEVGEIGFEIKRAWFEQGYLVLTGEAGTFQAGAVEGHTRITGIDGIAAFRGQVKRNLGLKTPYTTWAFTETIWIRGTQPEPAEFDWQNHWTVKATYPPPRVSSAVRAGRWLARRSARQAA